MNNIKARISQLMNRIHIGSIYLAMVLLVGMCIIIIINVFMRYVLNSGLRWGEEVAKLLMVWFTFIAMAVGVKQGLHISLHLLPKKLPGKLDGFLIFMKDFVILIIAVVFLIYGIKLVQFTSTSIMPATEWPSSILYLILPISAVLIASEALMDIFGIEDNPEEIEAIFTQGEHNG
ncbi:MAG: TRAP transporter small permease [Spirochaetes bacterium]|nr:MAG: TRAP transporter small permease [Spirochaetota bacterium]RKX78670.1 MAG: TRAP transporter small permease [Spirochaetota bacterium]RKX89255.1 MAG: TRAP transporter small permease [Spirochaetota bacterium]RKX96919.1 MAG: TRAP transporter small permease [Spirochaetota bacterium]